VGLNVIQDVLHSN